MRFLAFVCLTAAGLFGCSSAPTSQPSDSPPAHLNRTTNLDTASWRFGESREALTVIADEVRDASMDETRRDAVERQLIDLLESPHASVEGASFVCRQLARIGSDTCVPALRRLLPDPALSDMARYALETIEGEAAARALRDSIETLDGTARIGVIRSLGKRRDAQSIPVLDELIDSDPDTLAAVLHALGEIGSTTCATILVAELERAEAGESLADSATVLHSVARCADQLRTDADSTDDARAESAAQLYALLEREELAARFRMVGLRGAARLAPLETLPRLLDLLDTDDVVWQQIAASILVDLEGSGVGQELAGAVAEASPRARVHLIDILAERGEATALPVVAAHARDGQSNEIRETAIEALGSLGDPSTVPLLVELGGAGNARATASLQALRAPGVDSAIAACLTNDSVDERMAAALALGARNAETERIALFQSAETETDTEVRAGVLRALGQIGARDRLLGRNTIERALGLTRDAEEVRVLLRESAAASDPGVLRVIEPYLRDSSVGMDAARAAIHIAGSIGGDRPDEARQAMQRVMRHHRGDAELRRFAGSVVNEIEASEGFVRSWSFAGPYRLEAGKDAELLDAEFQPEHPDFTEWEDVPHTAYSDIGIVDLRKLTSADATDCVGYVRTVIHSAYEQDARLELGSDDGLAVWWNGERVHRNDVRRGLTPGSDIVPIRLAEGRNVLLAKVSQGGGDWKVCCRLRSPDGFALPNVTLQQR